ncbi:TonB-dependent receptor [Pseudoxanthomonas sp. CF125]|uniref:TonB-dependent receptor n=1 Tax=Pseudoxanthomonas sp. CF125 TaxID=1855303 RepID=UPI00088EB0EC|nr:TonB-dependent receptor [Pseudoxanthomonas sp. CF125]SDQ86104.1 iron complex outermembrane recepter protein [Pseudoxanthomonas sp. CF125]
MILARENTTMTSGVRQTGPRKRILVTACCLGLFAAQWAQAQEQQATTTATESSAQEQDVNTLDAVVVTGIRQSIAKSVETKNESNSIVEAISAEDIGKLPDLSIADSISRLPGLATQRVDGRSQVINIRGMSEQFAGTLLNGREQVSTGDSRGVEFDQYPAELINAVTVYKTPDAALIGQGLSGTVDLQTIRPLDFGERRIVFSGHGEKNSLGEVSADGDDKGYRASASYVDQFADNTVGVALGIARISSPFQEEHYKAWWWADLDAVDWGDPPQAGRPANAIALQGSEGWVKSRDLTRDGVMGVLEFKPNETYHGILDLYYSKFDQDEVMHGTMWSNDPWFVGENGAGVTYSNATTTTIDGHQVVTGGTLNNVQPIVRNDSNTREDKLYSAGWSNTFKWDKYTLGADLSYSRAERNQSVLELYAGRLDGQSIDFNLGAGPGFNQYSLPDMADPNAVYLWDPQHYGHDGRLEDSRQEDTIKAFRLALNRTVDSDFLRSYDVGVNFNKRTKEKVATVYFADLPNGRAPQLVDPSDLNSPTSLGFVGMGDVLSFNPRRLLNEYYDVYVSESNDDLRKDFTVEEDVKTFYFRANLDMDLTDRIRLRGNAGVQYIRTDQESTGFNAASTLSSQTLGTSYGDILPSLNLVADFGDGWMLRFGAAKTLMRPPINYLSADSSAGVSTTAPFVWSGSGGNPTLEPYRARAFDLSFEKYFGEGNYVGLALFYKELETYIYRQNFPNWDFSEYTPDPNGPVPVSNFGNFSTWANGTGGLMRGVELSTALSGNTFHPALDGFGAQLNVSYTESSIDPDPNDSSLGTDTIPGLSKIVANATVYYEKHGFSARLSQRYRDRYRGEYSALFGQRQYRFTLSERTLDLQLNYDFPESSPLSGLSVLLQANNLTNEPFRTEVSESTGTGLFFPEEYTEYGRQYLIGFRYKL